MGKKEAILEESCVGNAWQIFGGTRTMAVLKPGTVFGTSRRSVNKKFFNYRSGCACRSYFGRQKDAVTGEAKVGAGLAGVGSQAHRLYLSTKFERA